MPSELLKQAPVAMFKESPHGTVYIETFGGLGSAKELVGKPLYQHPKESTPKQAPVAAQHRFRHPQKTMPDWSAWQPTKIADRPEWEIDSQGYEVEYRALYLHPKGE